MRKSKRKQQYKWNVFDRILLALALFLLVFSVIMVIVFCLYQSVPDSLIVAVFGMASGECGFMAWIKRGKDSLENKNKNKETVEDYE